MFVLFCNKKGSMSFFLYFNISPKKLRLSLFWKPLDFGTAPGMRWQPLLSSSGKIPQSLELWKYIQFTLWSFPKSDTFERKHTVHTLSNKNEVWNCMSGYSRRDHENVSFLGKYLTRGDFWSPGLWVSVADMLFQNISSLVLLRTIVAMLLLFC